MSLTMRSWAEHIALILVAVGGPLSQLLASPLYSSGDEAAHVDYALQVWHGHLPIFENGLELQIAFGYSPPVQWTAQHPPLFYLLLAPIVGPLVDTGHVTAAGLAARLVVVALSVALVYCVRFAARQLFGENRALELASALIVALSVWYTKLGGSVYNDILAVLLATLMFALAVRLLLRDRSWLSVSLFVLAGGACSLTRLSIVPLALLFAGAVALGAFLVGRGARTRVLIAGFGAVAAMLVASGWFYARNVALTGGISGGHTDWTLDRGRREIRPVREVALDSGFWERMLTQFVTRDHGLSGWSYLLPLVLLFLIPAIAGAVVCLVHVVRGPGTDRLPQLLIIATMACAAGGIMLMQVIYTADAGGENPRYFFAMVPFLALWMARALTVPPRLPVVLAAWVLARVLLSAWELKATLGRELSAPQGPVWPTLAWTAFAALAVGGTFALTLIFAGARRDKRLTAEAIS